MLKSGPTSKGLVSRFPRSRVSIELENEADLESVLLRFPWGRAEREAEVEVEIERRPRLRLGGLCQGLIWNAGCTVVVAKWIAALRAVVEIEIEFEVERR